MAGLHIAYGTKSGLKERGLGTRLGLGGGGGHWKLRAVFVAICHHHDNSRLLQVLD